MSGQVEETAERVDVLWEGFERLWEAVAAAGIELPQRPDDPLVAGLIRGQDGDWVTLAG